MMNFKGPRALSVLATPLTCNSSGLCLELSSPHLALATQLLQSPEGAIGSSAVAHKRKGDLHTQDSLHPLKSASFPTIAKIRAPALRTMSMPHPSR